MKCFKPTLVACLAFGLGAATIPARADDNSLANPAPQTVQVYKQGKQYVVAIYRPDGSETLALVDAPHVKPAGNGASGPDLADLMKNGKVAYSVDVAPGNSPVAQSLQKTEPKLPQANKSKSAHKLTAKEKVALKRIKAKVMAMDEAADTIGKAVAHALPLPAKTPAAKAATTK